MYINCTYRIDKFCMPANARVGNSVILFILRFLKQTNKFYVKYFLGKYCLPFASIWVHPCFFGGVCVAHCLSSFLLLCIMCLYVLGSVTISAYRRCSVGLYLQLFVGVEGGWGEVMSYVRYLCLFTHSGVQSILCCFYLRVV